MGAAVQLLMRSHGGANFNAAVLGLRPNARIVSATKKISIKEVATNAVYNGTLLDAEIECSVCASNPKPQGAMNPDMR